LPICSCSVQERARHVFISYVHEDSDQVDALQRALQAAGVRVWRDKDDLWPGDDWRMMISRAITDNALVFLACFSSHSAARTTSYQNEELTLAVEQFRLRPPDAKWLIPVRFDDCQVPGLSLGAGRTLDSIQRADLFGDRREAEMKRLVTTVQSLLGRPRRRFEEFLDMIAPEGYGDTLPKAGQQAEARRLAAQQWVAAAEVMTEAVHAKVAAFASLLHDRSRRLAAHTRRAEEAFNAHGAEAFVDVIQRALATSVFPEGLDGSCAAQYVPEAGELWMEYELPRQQVVPEVTGYRYVKAKDLIQPEPRKSADIKTLYEKLIARVALRTLAEAFDVAPVTLVRGIVFNGYVSAKDRATGQAVRPLLISVHATRDAFGEIVLDEPELDLVACLRGYLNAVISPHPYDLEPVRPVLRFDLSKYKFVEEMNVIAGLDSRPDLLVLKPVEFEHLFRELFEQMGMKSWVTQASRDEGVDGSRSTKTPSSAACTSFRPSASPRSSLSKRCTRWPVSWKTRTPPKASWSPPPGSAKPAATSPPATAAGSRSSKAASSGTCSKNT
jgi:hypothetical protein